MKKEIPPILGIIIIVVFSSLIILYLIGLMVSFPPETTLPTAEKETGEEEGLAQAPEKIEISEEIQEELKKEGGIVKITAEGFEPKEITLTQGEAISFINYDSKIHQVVSDSLFNTEEMNPGDIWTFPCNEKGTFEYWLKKNSEQKGKIIVK